MNFHLLGWNTVIGWRWQMSLQYPHFLFDFAESRSMAARNFVPMGKLQMLQGSGL
jgi:hypothetical protein